MELIDTAAGSPTVQSKDSPASRREQKKLDKRRRILEAAARLFDERGFEATTTSAVAEAAGIGKGTLFLYVPTKEDLLVAVFREEVGRAWDAAFASVDPAAPLIDQLLAAFGYVVRFHEQDPQLARAFLKELQFVSEPASLDVSDFMRNFMMRLTDLLVDGQARNDLEDDVPVRTLATNLYSIWFSLMQRRYAGRMTVEDLYEHLDAGFRLQLRGLRPS